MRVAMRLALWPLVAAAVAAASDYSNCSAAGTDCTHHRCCNETGLECYMKNQYWASCKATCTRGVDENEPVESQTPWTCNLLTPIPAWVEVGWQPGLQGTHYWDCNGAGCDATVLQPFSHKKFVYAPQYAPTDPAEHGGGVYGEKMWMTGAASDELAALLGPNTGCCGSDTDSTGCGQCLLVRNPSALNPDWTAVVMKKSRCPPWSSGCEAGSLHMDIAVPGYDLLTESTANVCGKQSVVDTYVTKAESSLCSRVVTDGVTSITGCDCSALPEDTPQQKLIKKGCTLFSAWGWTGGAPALDYQTVKCPPAFEALIGGAFGPGGVIVPAPLGPGFNWMWVGVGVLACGVCGAGVCAANYFSEQTPPPKKQRRKEPSGPKPWQREALHQRQSSSSSSESDS